MFRPLDKYCRKLKRELCCPRKLKNGFVRDARRMAEDFIKGNPGVSFDEVKRLLGEPRELAGYFMQTLDPAVISRHKRNTRAAAVTAVSFALLIAAACMAFTVYASNERKTAVITQEVTTYIGEAHLIEENSEEYEYK